MKIKEYEDLKDFAKVMFLIWIAMIFPTLMVVGELIQKFSYPDYVNPLEAIPWYLSAILIIFGPWILSFLLLLATAICTLPVSLGLLGLFLAMHRLGDKIDKKLRRFFVDEEK